MSAFDPGHGTALLLTTALIACQGSGSDDAPSINPSGGGGSTATGATTSAGGDTPGCDPSVPMLVRDFDGDERYYVLARTADREIALQVDTGAGQSFIFQPASAPDFTPDVADVVIGCDVISLPGRGLGLTSAPIEGIEVVGLLGADYFLAAPTRIDATARRIDRLSTADAENAKSGATPLPFDEVQSHLLVPVMLDGEPVRLMFDTGGATLRVGVDGQPGDEEVLVQDADGNIFSVFRGTATLATEALSERQVPVLRAPSFPYFEQTVAALGGNLHGLLGLEAFPGQALLIDNGRLYVNAR